MAAALLPEDVRESRVERYVEPEVTSRGLTAAYITDDRSNYDDIDEYFRSLVCLEHRL